MVVRKEHPMGRNVIFLDFDGVLRPTIPHRNVHRNESGCKALLTKANQIDADTSDPMLQYVFREFCGESCYCVRMLCQIPHTEIVLTTSWRKAYPFETLITFLSLFQLGCYVSDKTKQGYGNRAKEIINYLNTHKDIDHYLVIDDVDMEDYFSGHMLLCHHYLHLSQYHQGYQILNGLTQSESL